MSTPNQGSRTRLKQAQAARLGRLLEMEYSPSELAAELDIHVRQIWERFIPAGCPHRRDARGRLWIVGASFREWYRATQEARRHPMREDEGWCVRCDAAVVMEGPLTVVDRRRAEIVQGRCPRCGGKVNRARRRTDGEER